MDLGKIRFNKKIAVGIISLFCFGMLQAQFTKEMRYTTIKTENIRLEKGLSQNSVLTICQDHKGYMWFGTWDGLNRYDGINYLIFRPDFKNAENSISDQTINVIYEDQENQIWVGTNGGLNLYLPKSRSFRQFKTKTNSIANDSVRCIVQTKNILWIGTNDGLSCLGVKSKENLLKKHLLHGYTVLDLYIDQDKIYIGTERGMFVSLLGDLNSGNLNIVKDTLFGNDIIYDIAKDDLGNFYVGTSSGLYRKNEKENIEIYYHHSDNSAIELPEYMINKLFVDENNYLWIGTLGGGLIIFDPIKNLNIVLKHVQNENNSLSNDFVYDIYKDKDGIIWVGTFWDGANKIIRNKDIFKHINKESLGVKKGEIGKRFSNNIRSFTEDAAGNLYMATRLGLIMLDKNLKNPQYINLKKICPSLEKDRLVKAIITDRKGNIWCGLEDNGLVCFNPKNRQLLKYYSCKNSTLKSNYILSLFEDKKGILWIGSVHGLSMLNVEIDKFIHLNLFGNEVKGATTPYVYALDEDYDGNIWIGTLLGLCMFNKETTELSLYQHRVNQINTLSVNRIYDIFIENDSLMWLGTMGGGLNKFNYKKGKFTYYIEEDGLPNNIVYNIIKDASGYLWISTNFGLSQFNPRQDYFINFGVEEGLQSYEYNLDAAFKTKDGRILFGGTNGFNCFSPTDVRKDRQPPPVVISDFYILGKVQTRDLNNEDYIVLEHDQNFIKFHFAALDYNSSDKNRYRYRLHSVDRDWVKVGATNAYAEYTNLEPGSYVFQVLASNSHGVWNEKGITIYIKIKTPWYRTFIFRFSLLIVLIAIVFYVSFNRIKTIRARHKLEKQLYELEKQSLRLQMNPHFIFNSLNSIQSFILSNEKAEAVTYLSKFARLMRSIMSNSDKKFVLLKEELDAMRIYLEIEQLRFDNKFDFEIVISPEVDQDFISIPPMIIQPYIENAILHGITHKKSRGKIRLEVIENSQNTVKIVLEDDGVGREVAMQKKKESGMMHKSRGMLITKERLTILNEQSGESLSVKIIDLKDKDGIDKGTRVEIISIFEETY